MKIHDRIVIEDPDAGVVIIYRQSITVEYAASAHGVSAVVPADGLRRECWWAPDRLGTVPLRHPAAQLAVEQCRRLHAAQPPLETWDEETFLAKCSAA